MTQDKFVKGMLVVIAVLLAMNLVKSNDRPSVLAIESSAQAQINKRIGDQVKRFEVKPVQGYEVTDLKDVVPLGDGKSFVVQANNKFMVYQLDTF